MVKLIWQKGRIAATHWRFNRIRQVAPMCTCFLGPIWVHVPNGISIGSAVFAWRTTENPFTTGRPSPPQNCSFNSHKGIWTPI